MAEDLGIALFEEQHILQQHDVVVWRGGFIVYMAHKVVIGFVRRTTTDEVHGIGIDKLTVGGVVHRKAKYHGAQPVVVLAVEACVVDILIQPMLLILYGCGMGYGGIDKRE